MKDVDSTQPGHAFSAPPSDSIHQSMDHVQKRRPSRTWILGCLILSMLAASLLIVALPLAAYTHYQIHGLIVPGVKVGRLGLGGLSWLEAKNGLDVVYPQEMEIWVTDGKRTWKGKASDFGVRWDTEAMANQAVSIAHGDDFGTEISEMFESLIHGKSIDPILSFDIDIARIELLKWEATVNIPAKDAELTIQKGEVDLFPSERGLSLDAEATLSQLSENPEALIETRELRLVVSSQEPDVADLSKVKDEVEMLLQSAIIVHGYDPIEDEGREWGVEREIVGSWLLLEQAEAGMEINIDGDQVKIYAEGLSGSLGPEKYLEVEEVVTAIFSNLRGDPAPTLRIRYLPTQYLVQPDDTLLEIGWGLGFPYWMIMEANPYLYSYPLQEGDVLVIPSRDVLLPLPVNPDKRIVLSISEQCLWAYQNHELLYEFIISTGIDRSPTQPGVFQVQTHELNAYASVWDLYMPHFLGIYEAWPGFMNGLHGLPMLSGGRRLWADVLGRPASYGCIILDLDDAETLYNWAEDGVVVEILE